MSYLNGLRPRHLGALSPYTSAHLGAHHDALHRLLQEPPSFQGLGKTASNVVPFQEVVQRYNKGLSKSEIQAWVWYKRSVGVPMTGWEDYYLPDGAPTQQVRIARATTLLDTRRAEIRRAYPGELLGKWVRTETTPSSTAYHHVRSAAGLFLVYTHDAELVPGPPSDNNDALDALVAQGHLYYHAGELLPFPIYTFGNIYDRELQLQDDKNHLLERYGNDVYQRHQDVLRAAKPPLLSVTNPDPNERPIITAISDFAANPDTFAITAVREEFLDLESAAEFKKVNGKIARKNNKDAVHLHFDGERAFPLQHVFIKWLFTLQETDFHKSSAIDIADYYLRNRPLRDDRLSKEEKAELKAAAREEGEQLFSKFLHEVLTFDDQQLFLRSCCSEYCLSINECLSMSPSFLKLGAFLRHSVYFQA